MAGTGADSAPRINCDPSDTQAMPMTQPAKLEPAADTPSDSERLVDQLANRIGGLGVELADVAGNLQEGAGRVSSQADRFGHLQKTAETIVSANHNIATPSQAAPTPTPDAVGKNPQRRPGVEAAGRPHVHI